MLECFVSRYSLVRVQLQHSLYYNQFYLQQIDPQWVQSRYDLTNIERFCFFKGVLAPPRQSQGRWPSILVWSTQESENSYKLILLLGAREQRSQRSHFRKNAAHGPDVNVLRVTCRLKQHIGGSIPKGQYFMCEAFTGDTRLPGKSEVSNFENFVFGNE